MSQPVARNSDLVVATDVHQEIKQTGSGPVIVPVEHAHRGPFVRGLADSFRINGERVALEGAVALTLADHAPKVGERFVVPPNREGIARLGGRQPGFFCDGVPVVVNGDKADTCCDAQPSLNGRVEVLDQGVYLDRLRPQDQPQPWIRVRPILAGGALPGASYRVVFDDGSERSGDVPADGWIDERGVGGRVAERVEITV